MSPTSDPTAPTHFDKVKGLHFTRFSFRVQDVFAMPIAFAILNHRHLRLSTHHIGQPISHHVSILQTKVHIRWLNCKNASSWFSSSVTRPHHFSHTVHSILAIVPLEIDPLFFLIKSKIQLLKSHFKKMHWKKSFGRGYNHTNPISIEAPYIYIYISLKNLKKNPTVQRTHWFWFCSFI